MQRIILLDKVERWGYDVTWNSYLIQFLNKTFQFLYCIPYFRHSDDVTGPLYFYVQGRNIMTSGRDWQGAVTKKKKLKQNNRHSSHKPLTLMQAVGCLFEVMKISVNGCHME